MVSSIAFLLPVTAVGSAGTVLVMYLFITWRQLISLFRNTKEAVCLLSCLPVSFQYLFVYMGMIKVRNNILGCEPVAI